MTRERAAGRIEVAPGRELGFASFGPSGGDAIVWLHGTPGAATQIPDVVRRRAERDGVRVIGIDRPGVGDSSAHVYPEMAAFADDLAVLLDTLGIDTCAVAGLSGGGPYTLAAAARLGDRVRSVAVLGGVAPTVGPDAISGGAVALARFASPALSVLRRPLGYGFAKLIQAATPVGDPAIRLYARFSPDADRELLNRPEFKEMFLGDLTSRGRQQFSAFVSDVMLFTRDWGFTLGDVEATVHWWHGTDDNIVPFAHGEHVVARLADASLHPIIGGGHLAGLDVGDEVLDALLGT